MITRFSIVVIPHIHLTLLLPQTVIANTSRTGLLNTYMALCSITQIPFPKLQLLGILPLVHSFTSPKFSSLASRILIPWQTNSFSAFNSFRRTSLWKSGPPWEMLLDLWLPHPSGRKESIPPQYGHLRGRSGGVSTCSSEPLKRQHFASLR